MVVQHQSETAFVASEVLGIGIMAVDETQRHIGLIYCLGEDEQPRLCHLAFHFRITDESLPADYLWAGCSLDSINKTMVAAFIAQVHQNAKSVPYGLGDYKQECWDAEGKYIPQPIGWGLTCATFVLSIFTRLGFDLLDTENWPNRPEDAHWQQHILRVLKRHASAEHVAAAAADIGAKRFRPEEVAAVAIMFDDLPLTFEITSQVAAQIIEDVNAVPSQ